MGLLPAVTSCSCVSVQRCSDNKHASSACTWSLGWVLPCPHFYTSDLSTGLAAPPVCAAGSARCPPPAAAALQLSDELFFSQRLSWMLAPGLLPEQPACHKSMRGKPSSQTFPAKNGGLTQAKKLKGSRKNQNLCNFLLFFLVANIRLHDAGSLDGIKKQTAAYLFYLHIFTLANEWRALICSQQ